jgi:hypothetical protein
VTHGRKTLDTGVEVWVELGDPDSARDNRAVERASGAMPILGRFGRPGGPAYGREAGLGVHGAYELLRSQTNPMAAIIDAAFVGRHNHAYFGNISVSARVAASNHLGQQVIDPIVDDDFALPPANHFLQSIRGESRSVEINRPAHLFERTTIGSVEVNTPVVDVRKRMDNGASDTGPYIGDSRTEKWFVLDDGTFFTRGGLFVMGDDANIIARGGSVFVEYGGVVCVLGPGVSSDDAVGTSLAMARTSGTGAQIGDIYGNSIDLVVTGSTSTLRAPRLIVAEQAAPSAPAAGFYTIYAKSDGKLYGKNDAGTEHDLTSGGSGSGPTFSDADFAVYDNVDNTKILAFQVSGIATGNTRTITVPNASGNLPLLETDNTWTGVMSVRDDSFELRDSADATKRAQFGLGGLTTGTTRIIALQDEDGTMPLLEAAQAWDDVQQFETEQVLAHIATPSAPAAGYTALYAKADGKIYRRPAGGAEAEVGGGVTAPLALSVADAATTTVTEVLSVGHTTSGTAAAGFGARVAFDLEDGAGNTEEAASIDAVWADASNGSEDADLVVRTRKAGATDETLRIASPSYLTMLRAASAPGTPSANYAHLYATSADGWRAKTSAGVTHNLTIEDGTSFTPTGTHIANTTYSGFWRRRGNVIDMDIGVKYTGAPTAANLDITWHSIIGVTVDTGEIPQPLGNASERFACVTGCAIDFGSSTRLIGGQLIVSTSLIRVACVNSAPNTEAAVSNTVPFSFGNGDALWISVRGIPITEWAA